MDESFEDWYRQHHQVVVAAVVALCADDDLAREAADEAFVRALVDWGRVSVMGSPLGWTCRVAQNVARRSLRRRSFEARVLRRDVPVSLELPDSDLWAAVRTLPDRQRLAVTLRFVVDLPEAEIATAMGISRGTVASTLAAARRRLSELLEQPWMPEVIA